MKKYLVAVFIGVLILSCASDDKSNEDLLVIYNQTYCADPWEYADNDNELAENISTYFKSVDIEIFNVEIDSKGTPQLCNACTCLSGMRIIAKVSEQDLNTIKQYGFQEYE